MKTTTQADWAAISEAVESPSPKLLRYIRGIIFDFDGTLFDNALFPFYQIAANPPDWLRLWRERLVASVLPDAITIYQMIITGYFLTLSEKSASVRRKE